MLDFATLTGACVYALTERMSGVFTQPTGAGTTLRGGGRAQRRAGVALSRSTRTSTADLESKIADIVQCALDGKGDHILAARFLQRFVPEDMPWAHVDLSSATRSGGLGARADRDHGLRRALRAELLLTQA